MQIELLQKVGLDARGDAIAEQNAMRHDNGGPALPADRPGTHAPDCPMPEPFAEPALYILTSCSVQVSDPLPYHRDRGWAPDGQAWVVVRLAVDDIVVGWDPAGFGGAVGYEVEPEDVVVSLDGEEPAALGPASGDEVAGVQELGDWAGDSLFLVPSLILLFVLFKGKNPAVTGEYGASTGELH